MAKTRGIKLKTICVVGPGGGDSELIELLGEHDRALFIEPMPEMCEFHRKNNPSIMLIEAACSDVNGFSTMNLYNEAGASSSLGEITDEAVELFSRFDLSCRGQILVRTVRLDDTLHILGIDELESLVIDAQGMDLAILKTVQRLLVARKIKYIQCEADGDGKRMYSGLGDNSEESFIKYFDEIGGYEMLPRKPRVKWNPDLEWRLKE